ncbi:pre-mRNA-splicing factor syf1 [Savitreella phatthalungensis]
MSENETEANSVLSLEQLILPQDITFEEQLLRDPYSLRIWLRYIERKRALFAHEHDARPMLFCMERACRALPASYKLWKMYLDARVAYLRQFEPPVLYEAQYDAVNDLYEEALKLLAHLPRLWLDYTALLCRQHRTTRTRRAFERALVQLSPAQHKRIWAAFLPWAAKVGGLTHRRVMELRLEVAPDEVEKFIDLLVEQGAYSDAVRKYQDILADPDFHSRRQKSRYTLFTELVDILVTRPEEVGEGVDIQEIIRSGLEKYTDHQGRLWCSLATYFVTIRRRDKAVEIFKEALDKIATVRDFAQIYDAYSEVEEFRMSQLVTQLEAEAGRNEELEDEADQAMTDFEALTENRALLLNDVLLRQNSNDVSTWEKRIALFEDDEEELIATYTKALQTIAPKQAKGKFSVLWIGFAEFYEQGQDDVETARKIMDKATRVPFKSIGELADVYCAWAELELRQDAFERAMAVMRKATDAPDDSRVDYFDEKLTPQARLHKNTKVWAFYLDLVDSVGSLDESRKVYDRAFALKVATPQTVVNYATLLEEHKYYEESFRVYERGLELFSYPIAFELWNSYLGKFLKRYGGSKVERARDLFEHALEGCPPKFRKPLYLLYAIELEEKHGLLRNAMRLLDRACSEVPDEDKLEVFRLYISRMTATRGLPAARPVYERALSELPGPEARELALEFAKLEIKLGEIDRARSILSHGAQSADPRTSQAYYDTWHKFELNHGNENTYAQMLQIKRSVAKSFDTDAGYVAAQVERARRGEALFGEPGGEDALAEGTGDGLIHDSRPVLDGFVSGGMVAPKVGRAMSGTDNEADASEPRLTGAEKNPDEIVIDEAGFDDDDDEEEEW